MGTPQQEWENQYGQSVVGCNNVTTGPEGVTGATGLTGSQGYQGAQGTQGATGV